MSTTITFSLPAPADAPEVRGTKGYFQPKKLVWAGCSVSTPDDIPSWIRVPYAHLDAARDAVALIDALGGGDE